MAKVLITSQGESLESPVDERFGRSAFFAIIAEQGEDIRFIVNPGLKADHGAAVVASQIVSEEGVEVVITGHLGPNAQSSLRSAGLKAYRLPSEATVQEAYQAFLEDRLEPLL